MTALLVLVGFVLVTLSIAVPLAVWVIRNSLQEKKNYERALKLVPLLIHLPPMSEDIEGGGRDVRDIVDENISKAQVIYNIIASTTQKGFKSRLYGQRHFSFEIVGTQGLVYFYAMVPIALVDVVKQAIISAYSSAQVEESPEHNIFNPVGKLTGVVGGEFVLKKDYAYPIATYTELKRDAMQSVLNALSTLEKEDGASIQILLRPTAVKWQQVANSIASDKRKGKKNQGFGQELWSVSKQMVTALGQPPEGGDKKADKPELSNLEHSVLDAIDDKTRYQGYEVLIRVIVSSNISQRAQAILSNVVAAFSLFDAPGKNGFKYKSADKAEDLVAAYLLRLFPQHKQKMILNAVELATVFHFPDQRAIPTSQLRRQESKQVDAPRTMPNEGVLLGYNIFRGMKKAIRLGLKDRQRHMYVVGQTGTGKSTFLENLALQDMLSGGGFAFVDPHGDTAERLLSMVPKERTEDVIYFSPADMDYPMGLNLFEFSSPEQKDFLIQEALNMLYKLYDPQHQGIMGPRYEHFFRNAALTIMSDTEGGTFVDIPKLFRDQNFLKQKLQNVTDQNVKDFWEKEVTQAQRSNEFGDLVNWFISKFGAFLSNEMMRNIIGQTTSAFNLREVMDEGKILLVNLSKGRTGELNHKLLGMIFVMKFQVAAMSRANIKDENQRRDFCLYVDEFQNFSTDSFATILSEARKYHLNLIVANQYTKQLTEEIRDAVFGNVGTVVSFRVGNDDDADTMAKRMQPSFGPSDFMRMPNFNAAVRAMVEGVPTMPFSMATLPPLGSPNEKLSDALKQLSAAKYGRPKKIVEEEIFERMKTKYEPPKPSFGGPSSLNSPWASAPMGGPAGQPFGPGPSMPGAARPSASFGSTPTTAAASKPASSFLDDWLVKRQPTSATDASDSGMAAPAWPSSPMAPPAPITPVAPAEPVAFGRQSAPMHGAADDLTDVDNILKSRDIVQPVQPLPPTPTPPEPIDTPATNITDATDVVDLLKARAASKPADGVNPDTIFIDQEGTFHPKQDTPPIEPK